MRRSRRTSALPCDLFRAHIAQTDIAFDCLFAVPRQLNNFFVCCSYRQPSGIWPAVAIAFFALASGGAGAESCTAEQVGQTELAKERGHYQVAVVIDRKSPIPFVVDTGAQKSAVDSELAARLELPRSVRHTRLTGTDGREGRRHPNVSVRQLEFSGLQHVDLELVTGELMEGGMRSVRGVVGADLLAGYDLELDYPKNRLVLFKVTGCEQGSKTLDPWAAPHDRVPLTMSDHTLSLQVLVDGKPLEMVLDTGAMRTKITMDAARKLGLDIERIKDEAPRTISRSLSGAEVMNYTQRFKRVRIGKSDYRDVEIKVSEIVVGGYDGLLGLDFLQSRKVWVSYATRQLLIGR